MNLHLIFQENFVKMLVMQFRIIINLLLCSILKLKVRIVTKKKNSHYPLDEQLTFQTYLLTNMLVMGFNQYLL